MFCRGLRSCVKWLHPLAFRAIRGLESKACKPALQVANSSEEGSASHKNSVSCKTIAFCPSPRTPWQHHEIVVLSSACERLRVQIHQSPVKGSLKKMMDLNCVLMGERRVSTTMILPLAGDKLQGRKERDATQFYSLRT